MTDRYNQLFFAIKSVAFNSILTSSIGLKCDLQFLVLKKEKFVIRLYPYIDLLRSDLTKIVLMLPTTQITEKYENYK